MLIRRPKSAESGGKAPGASSLPAALRPAWSKFHSFTLNPSFMRLPRQAGDTLRLSRKGVLRVCTARPYVKLIRWEYTTASREIQAFFHASAGLSARAFSEEKGRPALPQGQPFPEPVFQLCTRRRTSRIPAPQSSKRSVHVPTDALSPVLGRLGTGVTVGVAVGTAVAVTVGVGVGVAVTVAVAVAVTVAVAVAVGVGVGVGGSVGGGSAITKSTDLVSSQTVYLTSFPVRPG